MEDVRAGARASFDEIVANELEVCVVGEFEFPGDRLNRTANLRSIDELGVIDDPDLEGTLTSLNAEVWLSEMI